MKARLIKVMTLLGIGAVLFGAFGAAPAMADGNYHKKPMITHNRRMKHRSWRSHRKFIKRDHRK
jgi:hypothetical protein